MSWVLLYAAVLITVASRVLPMTLLPDPRGEVADAVAALPPPLFASLAALALVGEGMPPLPVLAAAVAALAGAIRRSLALTLASGLGGFFLAQILLR